MDESIGVRIDRLTSLEALTCLTVLVAFPLAKIAVFDELDVVRRYAHTGARAGWYLNWGLYLGTELVLVALCIAATRRTSRRDSLRFTVDVNPTWWTTLAIVTVGTAAIFAARALGWLTISRSTGADFLPASAATSWQRLGLLVVAPVAVLCEELLFRGFAITGLRQWRLTRNAALGAAALSFGYLHGGLTSAAGAIQTVLVTAAAVGLGALYLRQRSLVPGAILHLGWIWLFIALAPS